MRTIVVGAPKDESIRRKAVHRLAGEIAKTFENDDAIELECRGPHSLKNAVEAVNEAGTRNGLPYPMVVDIRDYEMPGGVVKTANVLTVHR